MAEPKNPLDDHDHERRVEKILNRARHEVGLRDFVTFYGARMWTAVLAIGAALYAAFDNVIESNTKQD